MKARSIALTLALCLIGAMSLAQSPQMGTWKLNETKSKIPAGMMKNTAVVYLADGDNVKVTTDGVDGAGKPIHTEWTGKFDGKDYPLTGDPSADARSYKQVNDHTLTIKQTKGGKVVTTGKIVISPDGKTRLLTIKTKDAAGKDVSASSAYDKE